MIQTTQHSFIVIQIEHIQLLTSIHTLIYAKLKFLILHKLYHIFYFNMNRSNPIQTLKRNCILVPIYTLPLQQTNLQIKKMWKIKNSCLTNPSNFIIH